MRILGIDWGERRVGFAISDPAEIIAVSLCTCEVENERSAVGEVIRLCAENDIELIVVGLPINMNGTKGPIAQKAEAFADRVRKALGLPVELQDERLSTAQVEKTLLNANVSRAKRKQVRDKLAAQVILQSFLDSRSELEFQAER
ncbi:MAG: Holliday junction resolvase RuvX [Kiritimatiellae bacterium]|nr:Holliday junction resolvase RuvX [Kiritimatiellia bacterium]